MTRNSIGYAAAMAIALVALAFAPTAHAQDLLANWNSTGANTGQGSYAPQTKADGVTISNLVIGAGVKGASGGNIAANVFAAAPFETGSYDAAKSANDYWEFCIVPVNASLSLSSLDFSFGGPNSGPKACAWAWSRNRSSWTALETFTWTDKGYYNRTIDLSTLPSTEGPIWFRLYAWGGTDATTACGSFGQDTDVLTLYGTLASLSEPPVISFDPAVPEVGVSNTLRVATTLLPRTGTGIQSATFSPTPAGTYSISGGALSFTPIQADYGKSFTYAVTATNAFGTTSTNVVVKVIDYQVPGTVILTFDSQSQTSWTSGSITEPSGSTLAWDLSGITVQRDTTGRDQIYGGVGRALRFSNSGTSTFTSAQPVLAFHANTQGVSKVTWHVGISGGLSSGQSGPTISLQVSPDLSHWITVDEFTSGDYAADGSLVKHTTLVNLAGPAYLRFVADGNGLNANLDQVVIEPAARLNVIDQYLLKYNVTPGDDLTGPGDDYDGDGRLNRLERSKYNPYLKD